MCYYLNIQFQRQRVKRRETASHFTGEISECRGRNNGEFRLLERDTATSVWNTPTFRRIMLHPSTGKAQYRCVSIYCSSNHHTRTGSCRKIAWQVTLLPEYTASNTRRRLLLGLKDVIQLGRGGGKHSSGLSKSGARFWLCRAPKSRFVLLHL